MNMINVKLLFLAGLSALSLQVPVTSASDGLAPTPLEASDNGGKAKPKLASAPESRSEVLCDQGQDINQKQRPIYFAKDSSLVDSHYLPLIKKHAACLNNNPQLLLKLTGNTDMRSSHEFAMVIGQKRAEAVQKIFIDLGIKPQRIIAISNGKEKPGISKFRPGSEKSAQQERRVDFSYGHI
jgi:outer membrane protein OmpA-like peptidoglycan-associated protein